MWSEYLRSVVLRRASDRNSSAPSRRCSTTSVPRLAFSTASIVYSPVPSDSQRTASPAGRPARRVRSVTRSATMNEE